MEIIGQVAVQVKADLSQLGPGFAEAQRESAKFDQIASKSLKGVDQATKGLTATTQQANAAIRGMTTAESAAAQAHIAAATGAQKYTNALNDNNRAMRTNSHMRSNMIFQLNDIGVSLASGMNPAMVAVQQLPQMLQFGLRPALASIGEIAGSVVTKFAPFTAVLGAAALGIAGLTYEINKTAKTQVSMLDVMIAGWEMFAEQVGRIISPIWDGLVTGLKWVWDRISPTLKDIGNGLIRPFAFGVEAIGILWQKLPAAIGDAMITTANVIVKGIEWSINGATRLLNDFLGKYNEGLAAMGQKPIPLASGISIPQAANPYQGALGELGAGLDTANMNANSTDYLGDMFGGLSRRSQEVANRPSDEESKKAASEADRQRKAYQELTQSVHQQIAASQLEIQTLGMNREAAAALRIEQELLNKAANDNIDLTPKQTAELGSLAQALAAAEEASRRLTEIYEFGKGVFSSFFGDIRSGIEEGKGLWESLGQAATNALDSIASKALEMAANGIFDMIFGSLMGGLSGGFGGLGGGMFGTSSITGSSGGFFPGFANGTNSAPGGLSWVGERGPELLNLPRGAQVIPNGPSMAMAANQNAANNNGEITLRLIMPDGWKAEIVGEANANAVKIVQANDKARANYRQNGGN